MKRRYLNYSLVFYEREDSLKDIQNRVNDGFSNLDKQGSLLKSTDSLEKFKAFNKADIVGQREFISKNDGIGYINALFDILSSCNHDNFVMMYVVPTIDGIILGKKTVRVLNNSRLKWFAK